MMPDTIFHANIRLDNGTPSSVVFDDIYFSPDDGLNESYYNFIEGNQLPKRFANLADKTFTVAETGFGTGLNFLLTSELWKKQTNNTGQLHYISVEKYPIPVEILAEIYEKNGWTNDMTETLLTHYPHCKTGHYIINIDNHIRLSLLFGDAMKEFQSTHFLADAWFLDGFAPSKNPEMWSAPLLQLIARRSRKKASFATFTAASIVRKNLLSAGFHVEKGKGFGRKRERLLGYYSP